MDEEILLFVVATRLTGDEFWTKSALGRSIADLRANGVQCKVFAATSNKAGLAEVYNRVIKEDFKNHILVFVHDDVSIHDFYMQHRLKEALARYDIIGMAGNRRYMPKQPAWSFPEQVGQWDSKEYLLGAIRHKTPNGLHFSRYGAFSGAAVLIDGVFMAVKAETLLKHKLTFDEQFKFHFYDLDFSLSAHIKGLKIGVWPIAITHESGGAFNSAAWQQAYALFCAKHTQIGTLEATPLQSTALNKTSQALITPVKRTKKQAK